MVQRYYQATSSTGCPAYFRSLFVRKSFGIFGAKTVQVDNSVGVGPVPRGRWGGRVSRACDAHGFHLSSARSRSRLAFILFLSLSFAPGVVL